jgi:quercetin dioxygenase-like cupin family protein
MSDVLLTPNPNELTRAQHGLRMFELVNSSKNGNLPGAEFSLGYLELEPEEDTGFHYHGDAFVLVVLLTAGVEGAATDVLLEDEENAVTGSLTDLAAAGKLRPAKRCVQHPGQVLVIQPGKPHRATNLSRTTNITGFEVRIHSRSVFADNNLLPFLDSLGFEVVADPVATWRAGVGALSNGRVG